MEGEGPHQKQTSFEPLITFNLKLVARPTSAKFDGISPSGPKAGNPACPRASAHHIHLLNHVPAEMAVNGAAPSYHYVLFSTLFMSLQACTFERIHEARRALTKSDADAYPKGSCRPTQELLNNV